MQGFISPTYASRGPSSRRSPAVGVDVIVESYWSLPSPALHYYQEVPDCLPWSPKVGLLPCSMFDPAGIQSIQSSATKALMAVNILRTSFRLLDNRQGDLVARAVNSGVRYDPSAETAISRDLPSVPVLSRMSTSGLRSDLDVKYPDLSTGGLGAQLNVHKAYVRLYKVCLYRYYISCEL